MLHFANPLKFPDLPVLEFGKIIFPFLFLLMIQNYTLVLIVLQDKINLLFLVALHFSLLGVLTGGCLNWMFEAHYQENKVEGW